MAQIITFPDEVNFEKNPIVIKFKTDETHGSFSKAVCQATLKTKSKSGGETIIRTEKYSIPLEKNTNKAVSFDLSSLSEMANPAYASNVCASIGAITRASILIHVKLYEEYLMDGGGIGAYPPLNSSFPVATHERSFNVITGGLSDYERFTLNTEVVNLIGTSKVLSRKPAGELLHPDSFYVIPVVTNMKQSFTSSLFYGKYGSNDFIEYGVVTQTLDKFRCFCYRQSIANILKQSPGAEIIITRINGKNSPDVYIGKKYSKAYHFHFSNGFGMMESITCYAREKKTSEMKTTESILISDRDFKNIISSFTRKGDNQELYLMNTGIISKEWADWFISDFFSTNECYMFVDDTWIPVSIIPDDKITIYDFNKPEPINFDFTVKPLFNGSLNNRFVK